MREPDPQGATQNDNQDWLTRWILNILKSLFQHKIVGWGLSLFYTALFIIGAGLCIYTGAVLETYGTLYTFGWVFLVSGIMLSIYQTIVNTASSEIELRIRTEENVKHTASLLVVLCM